MKPLLENISTKDGRRSFSAFRTSSDHFGPYWHYHPEIELTLITSGYGTRFVGDSIAPYQAGDLVLVGSNLPHQWISSPGDFENIHEAIVIHFPAELFARYPECEMINHLIQFAALGIHFQAPNDELTRSFVSLPELQPVLQMSQLMKILFQLSKTDRKKNLSKTNKFNIRHDASGLSKINRTIEYVINHIAGPITVNDMARETNLVPQSFCRWFRQQTGQTFISFLNNARIQQACQFLVNTDLPVQEIAFRVGFDNISHFNRTFKKLCDLSPSEFRKRI